MDKATRIQRTERIHKRRQKYDNYVSDRPNANSCLETPKPSSSCRCCGNPRKHEKGEDKLTIQERKKGWLFRGIKEGLEDVMRIKEERQRPDSSVGESS